MLEMTFLNKSFHIVPLISHAISKEQSQSDMGMGLELSLSSESGLNKKLGGTGIGQN